MITSLADAINAYTSTAATAKQATGIPATEGQENFADLLTDAVVGAIDNIGQGERVSAAAAVGKADLVDVVTAVSSAEVTLQTVVTVRDRVINAYQEIMRMPI